MTWVFDANHSVIGFENAHFGISLIKGRFRTAEVTIELDEDDLARSSVTATIDCTSVDSGNERRDETLRGETYLDVAEFPTAVFQSNRIQRRGEGYAIVGDFTLRGVTHEIELSARFNGEVTDQRGNRKRGFSAATTIHRSDFGINTTIVEGIPLAADEIRLDLQVEATFRE